MIDVTNAYCPSKKKLQDILPPLLTYCEFYLTASRLSISWQWKMCSWNLMTLPLIRATTTKKLAHFQHPSSNKNGQHSWKISTTNTEKFNLELKLIFFSCSWCELISLSHQRLWKDLKEKLSIERKEPTLEMSSMLHMMRMCFNHNWAFNVNVAHSMHKHFMRCLKFDDVWYENWMPFHVYLKRTTFMHSC